MTRLLEIIGEAAGRVSDETRQAISQIPWSQIVGLRNRLIHGYDEVDSRPLFQNSALNMQRMRDRLVPRK